MCGVCICLLSKVSISELGPWDFGTELQKTAKFAPGPKYTDLPAGNVLMQYVVDALIPLFMQDFFFNPPFLQNDSYPSPTTKMLKTQYSYTNSTVSAIFPLSSEKHQLTQALSTHVV